MFRVLCDADDADRYHASVKGLKKKNLSLAHEKMQLQVLDFSMASLWWDTAQCRRWLKISQLKCSLTVHLCLFGH